jgi:hypothetical protein
MNTLRAAPLETDDYVLTAIGLPEGGGKILVVGDNVKFETACASYSVAKDQIIRTAGLLDDGDHNAIDRAEWFVYEHLAALFRKFGRPGAIRLSDFETEDDLYFLKPEDRDRTTLLYHRISNREVEAILREEKICAVEYHLVRLADYMDWLVKNHFENTAVNRARFIAGE